MTRRRYVGRATLQNAATANGNGTPMDVGGLEYLCLQVTGITTATVTFEASIDGSNWTAVPAINQLTGAESATTTANGLFCMNCAGYAQVRAPISNYVAGAITVTSFGEG